MAYEVLLEDAPKAALGSLDKSVRERIIKRLLRMKDEPPGRHLKHGLPFFAIKIGQYRIAYTCRESVKKVYFAGDHNGYERWFRSL
ncbi:MAG: hypothetical protein V1708_05850 [Candidatus Micrarchaeota archaeon]